MIMLGRADELDHDSGMEQIYTERLHESETIIDYLHAVLEDDEATEVFRQECREYDLYYEVMAGPVVLLFTESDADDSVIVSLDGPHAVELLRILWTLPTSGAQWLADLFRELVPRRSRR